jgi:hypothetical protein
VVLGRLLQLNYVAIVSTLDVSYVVLSSTGYVVWMNGWQNGGNAPPLYYSGQGCTGFVYIADDSPVAGKQTLANTAVYSASLGTFLVPANADASGLSTAVSYAYSSLSSNACVLNSGTVPFGWLLTPVTNAELGFPATVALPLHLQ